jgi:hypothetical protein
MPTFPAWRPDSYSLGTGFARDVSGVLPGTGGWAPWPALEAASLALAAACRGAFVARSSAGAAVVFAGTATALYKFAGIATAWEDVTRAAGGAYAVPADGSWSFDQFGDIVIATNGVDVPQYYDLTSSTDFALVPGSPPVAKFVKVVGDQVFLISLPSTALGPTGILPNGLAQIAVSGFRDWDYWTLGQKSCTFMTFPNGGFVQGCTSLLAGLVFLERAVYRFGKDQVKVFDTAQVQEAQGTAAPHSIIQDEAEALYYSTAGFSSIGAGGANLIGHEWLNNWFLENCNQARLKTVIGARDPVRKRYFWIYPDTSNTASYARNGIVCFDRLNTDKPWSRASIESEYVFSAATPGATLSDLASLYSTLTGVPYPIGSDAWLGGAARIGAFDGSHMMAFYSGNGVAATVQTAEFMPIPGRRFYVNGFRIVGDATAATGRVHVKERPQDDMTTKPSASLTAQGFIPTRASGKILMEEVVIPAGEQWSFLSGVEHMDGDIRPDGVR